LRILLTNNTLASLQGSELYVYDVALELLRRGHTPIAYSPCLGEVARMLSAATVPVIDNIADCGETPDIIHGQHHFETLTAALQFPDAPVVSFCHGWSAAQEEPLIAPGVVRYVAVDETCRDRLIYKFGIEERRISVLLNFVDTRRFQPRGPLPEKPKRALAFGNHYAKGKALSALEAACGKAGIALDVAGWGSNRAISEPEKVLPGYDLVFAKARAAMEAMATGAAVILAGPRGTGPMVTSQNWRRLRPMNFGVRALDRPYTEEAVAEQIANYDPADAGAVSASVRAEASLGETVDRLVAVYEAAIEEHRHVQTTDLARQRAAARHLNRHSAAARGWHARDLSEATRDAFLALLKQVPAKPATLGVDVAGGLDFIVRRYGIVKIEGWAGDARSKDPATAIVVLEKDRCVGVGFPSVSRPDAAQWFGASNDLLGFELQFEAGEDALTVLALMPSGEVFDISSFAGPDFQRVLKGLPF
jgi:hypothetical protein